MIINPIKNKNIILGVTGSIAAYKAADLASKLTQSGAQVEVILTNAATEFISPITFQSITGQHAYTETDLWGNDAHVLHIGLAQKADMLVIAPASANTLAKLAQGIADNLLTVTALALHREEFQAPLLIAPAMDAGMFSHPATQKNVRILKQRGNHFIGPEEGHLASGLVAKGRMSEPATILGNIRYLLSRDGPLKGQQIVVTAGGTQEDIDPVRYITNRSSGKQGYALAQAAMDAGAEVTLISAPTNLPSPSGVNLLTTRSAAEMDKAVLSNIQQTDALIMAAAVADYRPANPSAQKIKKRTVTPSLVLERTSDILNSVKKIREQTKFPRIVVGFAAETQNLIANAKTKLHAKGLDLIVANDISSSDSGFGTDTNRVTLIWTDGKQEEFGLLSKKEVATTIISSLMATHLSDSN